MGSSTGRRLGNGAFVFVVLAYFLAACCALVEGIIWAAHHWRVFTIVASLLLTFLGFIYSLGVVHDWMDSYLVRRKQTLEDKQ